MGSAESIVHECVLLVGSSLQVFKQVEAAAWTKQRLEATEIPGSVLDNNRQASRLNKVINHGCIAPVPSDLQCVFAPCVSIAPLLLAKVHHSLLE